MIILDPNAKFGEKISKNAWDFVIFKIFLQLCQISVIDIKCPPFGQMSIFWGLVFFSQTTLKITKSLTFFEILPTFFLCGPKIIISQYYILITTLKNAPLYFLEGGLNILIILLKKIKTIWDTIWYIVNNEGHLNVGKVSSFKMSLKLWNICSISED